MFNFGVRSSARRSKNAARGIKNPARHTRNTARRRHKIKKPPEGGSFIRYRLFLSFPFYN
jgi:hypothetical protein